MRSLAVTFDIPDGWVWIHPTDIGYFGSGKTPAPDQLSKCGTVPYFKVADMNTVGNEVFLCKSNSFLKLPDSMKLFSKGAVVYPKNGGAVFTNKKRILGQDSLVDLNTGSYTPFSPMDEKYFYYLFSTVDFQKYYKGTALPTVDMDAVQEIVWALPPLAEQMRIVAAIELTLPLIDKYEETHSRLSRLQGTFPEALKKSILQEAVQGKLVPQDPSDEPAEALLERIRAEKLRLIKEGKIKKDKHESVIFRRDNSHYEKLDGVERCIDDELPFEIPDSWEWVRLIDICEYIQRGKSPKYSSIKKYPVIAQKCNQWSGFSIEKAQLIEPESITSYGKERILQDNDLMWNSTGLGTLGRMAVYKCALNPYELAVADSHVTVIRPMKEFISPQYLYYYFSNPTVQSVIEDQSDGTTKQKELSATTVRAYLVPLPPYNEQIRIVNQIEAVLPLIVRV